MFEIRTLHAIIEHKTSFIWFLKKVLRPNKLCIAFNFKQKYGKMSQGAENMNNSGNGG